MKRENLIPSLIKDDKTSLPKRGGDYESEESKRIRELEELEKSMKKSISNCNCYSSCYTDCNC